MDINALLSGAIAMAAFVIGLFFMRFWKSSRDRFFLLFGLAFWIEVVNRVYAGLWAPPREEDVPTYFVIRLLSYLLILGAIVEKNLRSRRR